MSALQTYAVYSDYIGNAKTNLSASEVVRHIYTDDGGDFYLEPIVITGQCDADGDDLPDIQATTTGGKRMFDVYFKDSVSFPWHKGRRIAIGEDEASAEESFLQESFDGAMWDTSRWAVLTTEQYLTELADIETHKNEK